MIPLGPAPQCGDITTSAPGAPPTLRFGALSVTPPAIANGFHWDAQDDTGFFPPGSGDALFTALPFSTGVQSTTQINFQLYWTANGVPVSQGNTDCVFEI